jgi:hypothetical protein
MHRRAFIGSLAGGVLAAPLAAGSSWQITTLVRGKERPTCRGAKPTKARGVAKRPVARTSRKTDGPRVRDLEMRLAEALKREAEALEQQTATAEILRVISASPMNLQPVLDTVVQSAGRFCGANDAAIFLLDGASFKIAAHHGPVPGSAPGRVIPIGPGSVSGRAVLER